MTTYNSYEDYIQHQSQKTLDPEKRKKWLNDEWNLKINGFKQEFSKIKDYLTPDKKCLCLGARTGQEVVALQQLGVHDVVGIDIVPCEPLVISGDIHNLDFKDDTFDFVYTNIIDHSIDPKKMISEIERVLKIDGLFFLQIQLGINQDEYTVFKVKDPIFDIVTLFDQSFCFHLNFINSDQSNNFAGMNVELIFRKDKKLSQLFKNFGNIHTVQLPEEYEKLWVDINLPIQTKKLNDSNILDENKRNDILNSLKNRAYYLTRIADTYSAKNILEVGTAEGWQFFSFGAYANEAGGKVFSCDPRDVRNKTYTSLYEDVCFYHQTTSRALGQSKDVEEIDMFYIDGLHDQNCVLEDVVNLINKQSSKDSPIWVFDDFDTRFGSYKDITQIISASKGFKIWNVGLTSSGHPNHQVLVKNSFVTN